jgi:hypothetical protein
MTSLGGEHARPPPTLRENVVGFFLTTLLGAMFVVVISIIIIAVWIIGSLIAQVLISNNLIWIVLRILGFIGLSYIVGRIVDAYC